MSDRAWQNVLWTHREYNIPMPSWLKDIRINLMMQEFHDKEPPEGAEIIPFIKPDRSVAPAGQPPFDDNWLEALPVGTSFLCTKKMHLPAPELIACFVAARKEGCTRLIVEIPFGNKEAIWYNTSLYSQLYIRMAIL